MAISGLRVSSFVGDSGTLVSCSYWYLCSLMVLITGSNIDFIFTKSLGSWGTKLLGDSHTTSTRSFQSNESVIL